MNSNAHPESEKRMNVVFDLGGVLIEWQPLAILKSVLEDAGESERVLALFFHHALWRDFDAGRMTLKEAVSIFAKTASLPENVVERILNVYKQSLVLAPCAERLISFAREKGASLFVLSNIHAEIFRAIESRVEFFNQFQGIVLSGEVGLSKPDSRIYRFLLETYALAKADTVFIDDVLENVEGAQSVGMHGIHFKDETDCIRRLSLFLPCR